VFAWPEAGGASQWLLMSPLSVLLLGTPAEEPADLCCCMRETAQYVTPLINSTMSHMFGTRSILIRQHLIEHCRRAGGLALAAYYV
jgi:hypothetical protein